MISTANQTILVTGASRGIGAATARVLLAGGASVVGSYNRSPGALADLEREYGSDRVLPLRADLGAYSAAKTLWREAMAFKGSLTGLVNNAGIMPQTPISADDAAWHADWAQVMAVNVQAVADLTREAVKVFSGSDDGKGGICGDEGARGGRIVTIASRASFRGDGPDYLHYAASKGAVVSLMRSVARAYAGQGIYAFLIAPGWVRTDMAAVAFEPGNEWMLAEVPMGDAAPPENIANMAAFFLAGLADHATGTCVDINGASYVR